MKNSSRVMLILVLTLLFKVQAHAYGYTESLFLCDIGIQSSNSSNQLGVDFIQYVLGGKTTSLSSSTQLTSSLANSLKANSSFDRWNSANAITDVSLNLESDYYGTQYYFEYCYEWKRMLPSDGLNYEVTSIASLSNEIPNTVLNVDTKCSLQTLSGVITDTSNLNTNIVKTALPTDFAGMRCTIRLKLNETSYLTKRPYNGDVVQFNPNVQIKVSP